MQEIFHCPKAKNKPTQKEEGFSYFVLYRCIIPWTISTDGFPLKNEIWSGSCLDGESGAAFTLSLLCSLLLCVVGDASEDFLASSSSFTNQKLAIIN